MSSMKTAYDAMLDGRDRIEAHRAYKAAVARQDTTSNMLLPYLQLAWGLVWEGEHAKAQEVASEAVRISKDKKSPEARVASLVMLGKVLLAGSKVDEARDIVDKALVLSKKNAEKAWEVLSLSTMAEVEMASGDLDRAQSYLDTALAAASHNTEGSKVYEARVSFIVAECHIKRGKLVEAQRHAQRASTAAKSASNKALEAEAQCLEATCHLLLNETQEAQYRAQDGWQAALAANACNRWQVEAMSVWMQAQMAEGKKEQARDTCQEILDLFNTFDVHEGVLARWHLTLAAIYQDLNDFEGMQREAMIAYTTVSESQTPDKELLREALAAKQEARNMELAGNIWAVAQPTLQYGHPRQGLLIMPRYIDTVKKDYEEMLQSVS
mmetsp:Transcript_7846/g.18290  ORF Transcript_7846/g.18290 Transcript_7846/m.18290 type:complete len:382 (-) Transcript_7846:29-1174(-)